jgi:hypothetical protein
MSDYTSITVRKDSEKRYQKAKIDYQGRTGKKINSLDFFDVILKKIEEAV